MLDHLTLPCKHYRREGGGAHNARLHAVALLLASLVLALLAELDYRKDGLAFMTTVDPESSP
ncbi:hypothetical protein XFF6991_60021 [Xanthomonas phaseoli pv. phaseoli]|uniref:Uncharacterized protein n=1 Tax=Xanthomonas campestris pv. phaseoli TaxID=317013 RepID=A0A7Z7J665_XANCH|nr:hypothetical protein XFF6991_60021 [Xanthomonas phaseoli pv. phaseoli]